jgi:hypothetical protein
MELMTPGKEASGDAIRRGSSLAATAAMPDLDMHSASWEGCRIQAYVAYRNVSRLRHDGPHPGGDAVNGGAKGHGNAADWEGVAE